MHLHVVILVLTGGIVIDFYQPKGRNVIMKFYVDPMSRTYNLKYVIPGSLSSRHSIEISAGYRFKVRFRPETVIPGFPVKVSDTATPVIPYSCVLSFT